jgi:hypothetical protein
MLTCVGLLAGVEAALRHGKHDILALRHLGSGEAGLPIERLVEQSRLLLWRIGKTVDRCLDHVVELGSLSWTDVVHPAQRWWDLVASMADHKLGGDKLQRMYQGLKEKGYQPPAGMEPLPGLGITQGEAGLCRTCAAPHTIPYYEGGPPLAHSQQHRRTMLRPCKPH